MTSVWPALCPPWNRAITSARSLSQSTSLPFPSSPHWAPTTTTLAMISPQARGIPRASIAAAPAGRNRNFGPRPLDRRAAPGENRMSDFQQGARHGISRQMDRGLRAAGADLQPDRVELPDLGTGQRRGADAACGFAGALADGGLQYLAE